jgi:chorismate mutase
VTGNTKDAIGEATAELLGAVLERNDLEQDDLVSIIFTATEDLTAEFPAVAARDMGLTVVPLLCAREIPVEGSLPSCIRVLLHAYAPPEREIKHVYLREAKVLREDLTD